MNAHSYDISELLARSGLDDSELREAIEALPALSMDHGPWLAGGAIRRSLRGQKLDSDLDVFFRHPDQMEEFASELGARGAVKGVSTDHVTTYTLGREGKSPWVIQLCHIGFYESAEAVIDSFDFTICQFVTDGKGLLVGPFSLWDLARKRLALHRLTYGTATMRRLIKYTRQGFTACSGVFADIMERAIEDPGVVRREVEYVD